MRQQRGARVAARLVWLVIAVAVPLLAFSTLAIWRVHESERAEQEFSLRAQARDLALDVDGVLDRVELGLQTLAASAALARGDLPSFATELKAASERLGLVPISLIGADGAHVVDTWKESGSSSQLPSSPMALAAMASHEVKISNLVVSQITGRFVTTLVVPVRLSGASRPSYALVAAIAPERLSAPLHELMPQHAQLVATVTDREGTVVARTLNPGGRIGRRLIPALLDRVLSEREGIIRDADTPEGVPSVFAFSHAPHSGYAVLVDIPDALFHAPLRTDVARAVGIGLLLLTLGLIAAMLLSRRLVTSLQSLAEGRRAHPVSSGLREVDDLATCLDRIADERDRVESAMDYQLTVLRTVTESTEEAIFLHDEAGRITYANPAAERLSGWRQEELIGQALHDVMHDRRPDGTQLAPWDCAMLRAMRRGVAMTGHEDTFFHRDGTAIAVECSLAPVTLEERVVGAVLTVRDMTARKRTDAVLRENEARLRDLLETLDLAVLLVRDPDGRITFWSQGCERLYGWTEQQAYGQRAHDLLQTRFPASREEIFRTLEEHGTWDGDVLQTCRDGRQLTIAAHAVLRRDAAGKPLAVIESVVDVSALREAQAELSRLNAELEQCVAVEVAARQAAQSRAAHAERMQALGQLAGGIAHDFNNVLQAVAGGAALIERRPADAASVRRLAHVVTDAASRGASITRRMLAFARRGDLQAEPVDPASLLEGLREICTYTLGASITVRADIPDGLPHLLADKGQLETALVNLATNARDAMPDGGTVTLSAQVDDVVEGVEHRANLAPGRYVRLTITDSGVGIESHLLPRVVEPFFTTKGVGKGTGLGLSMVKGFAEQSGGGFAIDSVPGQGTRAILWLPRAEAAAIQAEASDTEDTMAHREAGRILLVDDDLLVRETLCEQLEEAGYTVTAAADGSEALAVLNSGAPVDVLISDLSMPGMNGLAVIQAAQSMRPGTPAILLTGYAGDAAALAVGGAMSGSYSLIRKPVSGAQLVARVVSMMEPVA